MAKALGTAWKPEPKRKKTSQGVTSSSIKVSSMNKSKKRSYKQYRGQGR
jgi:hypothetical protein